MERKEFIQRLFIAAMGNPTITSRAKAVMLALEHYDAMVGQEESSTDETQQDTEEEMSENDYFLSLIDCDKILYTKMQNGYINKHYLKLLCGISRIEFEPIWEEILKSDAFISKPEMISCVKRKWEKQQDGHYGYTDTGERTTRAAGSYKFDTLKTCQLLLSKRPRCTEFIDNYLKYNS